MVNYETDDRACLVYHSWVYYTLIPVTIYLAPVIFHAGVGFWNTSHNSSGNADDMLEHIRFFFYKNAY